MTQISMDVKAGDLLIKHFDVVRREFPGRRRIAQDMFNNERMIPDEGRLITEPHWAVYKVTTDGSCLVAIRSKLSDFYAAHSSCAEQYYITDNFLEMFERSGFSKIEYSDFLLLVGEDNR